MSDVVDDRFEEIGSFLVVVPDGYNHKTVIADLRKGHHKEFYSWSNDSNDFNFANPSTVLTPGRRFKVKMLAIKRGQVVSSDDCLKIIAANKGILTGAQGAALAYKQGKSYMSCTDKWFVSFDKKNHLPKFNGYRRVPGVDTYTDGSFRWTFRRFERDLSDCYVLLCFCEENE